MEDREELYSGITTNNGETNETLDAQATETVFSEEILDELLVEDVRNYRILWDTSARGYKDTVKKNQAWTEISSRLSQNSKYIIYFLVERRIYFIWTYNAREMAM